MMVEYVLARRKDANDQFTVAKAGSSKFSIAISEPAATPERRYEYQAAMIRILVKMKMSSSPLANRNHGGSKSSGACLLNMPHSDLESRKRESQHKSTLRNLPMRYLGTRALDFDKRNWKI
jgi:hypothetical protein